MASESEHGKKELGDYSIRSAERVCDILDLLQSTSAGVALPDVAKATRLPKSSAFRYLATLENRRYVERDPDSGNYRLGLAFLPFQSRQFEIITQRARPHLEQLRDKFEETVNLGLLDGNRVTYLDIIESPRAVRLAARRGDRDLIHSTALGKAIAATLPTEAVRRILAAEGMAQRTDRTITLVDDYLGELKRVEEQGYAVDDGESESDGRCVAVPLGAARLPLAISVSAPAARLPTHQIEETAEILAGVAADLRSDLEGRPAS